MAHSLPATAPRKNGVEIGAGRRSERPGAYSGSIEPSVELCEIARKQRVHQGIGALLVEDEIGAQASFAPEARLLQNALGSHVVWHNERLDTGKPRPGHRPSSEE